MFLMYYFILIGLREKSVYSLGQHVGHLLSNIVKQTWAVDNQAPTLTVGQSAVPTYTYATVPQTSQLL